MNVFTYTAKEINKIQLEDEIKGVVTSFAIDSIVIQGDLIITFRGDITTAEIVLLNDIITSHVALVTVDKPTRVELANKTSDEVPYVYPTVLPDGWYTCFQGAGDNPATVDDDGIGRGNKFTFRISSRDTEVIKDFTFNEDIYLKDGYLIIKDAPLGACLSMEIHHPVTGLILPFARSIPLLGTARVPLDTSGRAFLPAGLIVRITVMNSKGNSASTNEAKYEDAPASFAMFGRFEIFRKMP